MKKQIGLIILTLGLPGFVARASVVDLNVDDIDTSSGEVPMPAGYGGLSWAHNIGVWGFAQYPYNPATPPNRVTFNYTGPIDVVAESLVTFLNGPEVFDGAYFSGNYTAQFNLYNGTTLVATSGVLALSDVATFLPSGYSGLVTSVGIVGDKGYFAMDDFQYGVPVPEPCSLSLACLGALALALRLRHQTSPKG
jgi:hypothetical protein